jgi:coenzyme PQQ precursor peptide PqqA
MGSLVRRGPAGRPACDGGRLSGRLAGNSQKDVQMTWETPILIELRVGMEVTSYESAEIDLPDEAID